MELGHEVMIYKTVMTNPVRLTTVNTAFFGVQIYDNSEYLQGGKDRVHFVGLYQKGEGMYQNGVEVGSIASNGTYIQYNGVNVMETNVYDGCTFGIRLLSNDLPNGYYVAVMNYHINGKSKNYEVLIQINLT